MNKLLELIKEHPDLEIVPMVDAEVIGDDCGYWMGEWGNCEVTEYYLGREKVHFKDDDEENVLCDMIGCEYGCDEDGRDIYELSNAEWEKIYQSIPWVKCIVVYISV